MWLLDLTGRVHPFSLSQFAPLGAQSSYLLLEAGSDPEEVCAKSFSELSAIAIRFPVFTDGRPFSLATILRLRGWRGPLIAVGDFLLDQLDYLRRVGFTGFAPDPERVPAEALARDGARLLRTFSEPYQGSVALPQPLWQRVARGRRDVAPEVMEVV